MTETYYGTKRSNASGTGRSITIDIRWGFEPGEIVKLKAYPIGKPNDAVNLYRKICRLGARNRVGFYLDKSWGFEDDDFIVFSITKVDKGFI